MSSTIRRGSSISSKEENLSSNVHFKWDSIKKFIYIAFSYSNKPFLSGLFLEGPNEVRIFDYVILQIAVGVTFLFMDFFIKQYTRKIDFMTYLNPLLRGITFGSILQSSLVTVTTAVTLSDVVRYLISSLQRPPSWQICSKKAGDQCTSSEDIITRCQLHKKTNIGSTSIQFYYESAFTDIDRATATTRTFIAGIVWMANFFFSTLSDALLVKMMRITFYWSAVSASTTLLFLVVHNSQHKYSALLGILNITSPANFESALDHVVVSYGIGLIGIHDYNSMSPYTMIDNTVVIYTIVHIMYAFVRALIFRILLLGAAGCVEFNSVPNLKHHYFLFVVTPLSMDFLPLKSLHTINYFVTMMLQYGIGVAMVTVTMARMLHNEFHSIRIVYIVGLLCAIGFVLSVPFSMTILPLNYFLGLMTGASGGLLFLGCYKVAIIMYIYGLEKFTTDIHFWLGFKPTKFWTLNWMITPIIFFVFLVKKIINIYIMTPLETRYAAFTWMILTFVIVIGVNLKIVIKYLQRNNVMGIFRAHPKYGPLDRDFLAKRKVYNETLKHKICKHSCIVYDESYTECDHAETLQDFENSSIMFFSSRESNISLSKEKSSLKKFFSRSSH